MSRVADSRLVAGVEVEPLPSGELFRLARLLLTAVAAALVAFGLFRAIGLNRLLKPAAQDDPRAGTVAATASRTEPDLVARVARGTRLVSQVAPRRVRAAAAPTAPRRAARSTGQLPAAAAAPVAAPPAAAAGLVAPKQSASSPPVVTSPPPATVGSTSPRRPGPPPPTPPSRLPIEPPVPLPVDVPPPPVPLPDPIVPKVDVPPVVPAPPAVTVPKVTLQ